MSKESQILKSLKIDIGNTCKILETKEVNFITNEFIYSYNETLTKIDEKLNLSNVKKDLPKFKPERLGLVAFGFFIIAKAFQIMLFPQFDKLERILFPILVVLLLIIPYRQIRKKIVLRKMQKANKLLIGIFNNIKLRN